MTYAVTISRADTARPALPWTTGWITAEQLGDWRIAAANDATNPGGLADDGQLASAVILSLFTDMAAPEGWRPDVADRRGWWGDAVAPEGEAPEPIGSHLWLLKNEVATPRIAALAQVYAEAALAWLLRDRVAARVTVAASLIEDPRRGVRLDIDIIGRDGALVYSQRFERFWQEVR